MDIAALIAWALTAFGGFVLLARWAQAGGHKLGASRLPAPVVFGHFLLAATGLVVWIIYVASDTEALAWIAVALLVVIALLGFTMLARWIPARTADPHTGASQPAADARLPLPVVVAHGLFAVTTLTLVVLSAAGVGGS